MSIIQHRDTADETDERNALLKRLAAMGCELRHAGIARSEAERRAERAEAALSEVLEWWKSEAGILTHDYEQGIIEQPDYPHDLSWDHMMAIAEGSDGEDWRWLESLDGGGNLGRYRRWRAALGRPAGEGERA